MEILMQTTTNPTTMATAAVLKPKERQFQVVPVPAIFTRGRWECRDFKEVTSVENQILEFVEKQQAIAASNVSTSTVIPVIPIPVVSTTISEATIPQKIVILPNTTGNNTPSLVTTNTVYNTNDNGITNTIDNSSISSTNTITNGNIVAIDNKIEQAMDLVKTHLTFAVREEVEILRSTISDLEIRVNQLDNENQILRQFAPTEVVNNIALLMQQQQKNSQQQQIAIDQQQPLQQLLPPPSISSSISSVQQIPLIHESSQPS